MYGSTGDDDLNRYAVYWKVSNKESRDVPGIA